MPNLLKMPKEYILEELEHGSLIMIEDDSEQEIIVSGEGMGYYANLPDGDRWLIDDIYHYSDKDKFMVTLIEELPEIYEEEDDEGLVTQEMLVRIKHII